jgi:hypothetical protein
MARAVSMGRSLPATVVSITDVLHTALKESICGS